LPFPPPLVEEQNEAEDGVDDTVGLVMR